MWITMLTSFFNFKKFGAFIAENWKMILVALMLATIIYQNFFETRYLLTFNTIPYLEKKLEDQEKVIEDIADANKLLTATIETSNKKVQEWKEVSDKLEKNNKELSGELLKWRDRTLESVQTILKGETPQSCEASIQYLRNSIPEIQFYEVDLP